MNKANIKTAKIGIFFPKNKKKRLSNETIKK